MEKESEIYDLLARTESLRTSLPAAWLPLAVAFTRKVSPYHRSLILGDHIYSFGWLEPNLAPSANDVEWPEELVDISDDEQAYIRLSALTRSIIDPTEPYDRETMILSLSRLLHTVVARRRKRCFADNQEAMQRGAVYLFKSQAINIKSGCEGNRLASRIEDRRKNNDITVDVAAVERRAAQHGTSDVQTRAETSLERARALRDRRKAVLTNECPALDDLQLPNKRDVVAEFRTANELWKRIDQEERIESMIDRSFGRYLVDYQTPLDNVIDAEEGTITEKACTQPQDKKTVEYAAAGWTDAEIGKELGLDRRSVKKIIVRVGREVERLSGKKPRKIVRRRPGKAKQVQAKPEIDRTWPSYHTGGRQHDDPMPPTDGLFDEDGYKLGPLPRSFERPASLPKQDWAA